MDEWEKLKITTAEALSTLLAKESEAIGNDSEELSVIASRMVGYWQRSLDGDETADRMLRHLKVQARLLVAIHEVQARRNLATTVERILTVAAETGLAFLKAGLKAAL